MLFPSNLTDSVTIGYINQRLDIRMNQYILTNICTNTLDYTIGLSNQNLSAITCKIMDNPACATMYNPTLFTILEASSNKLHLSILGTHLITKYQLALYIQKQFYMLLFNNPIGPCEENIITCTNSSGL